MKAGKALWRFGIGLAAFTLLLSLWPVMNIAGFCWAEKRFLSQDEAFELAIKSAFEHYPPEHYGHNGYDNTAPRIRMPIQYGTYDQFKSANPNCCKVVSNAADGFKPDPINRVLGHLAYFIEIKYRVEDEKKTNFASEGLSPGMVRVYGFLTNCGRSWNGI
jgi:hypothetical protein